jgi:hypothetical protein
LFVVAARPQGDLVTRTAISAVLEVLATIFWNADFNSDFEMTALSHPHEISKIRNSLPDCAVRPQ